MNYYAEVKGNRVRITEWMYEALVRLHGWHHVIQQEGLAIVGQPVRAVKSRDETGKRGV